MSPSWAAASSAAPWPWPPVAAVSRSAVLERGRICGEASSAAGGLICGQYDADYDTPLVRLRLAGRDAFPEFAQLLEELSGVDVGFVKGPTIGVARTDEQRQLLLAQVARQLKAGFHVEFIEPDEAHRREPLLPPDVTGAALYPDGQVDTQRWPPIVHRALLAAGVDVYEGTEVVALSAGATNPPSGPFAAHSTRIRSWWPPAPGRANSCPGSRSCPPGGT